MADVKMKFVLPTDAHQALRDDLYQVLVKHKDMQTREMVGVIGQLLGHIFVVTSGKTEHLEGFISVIGKNIAAGYESARLQTEETQGNA